jgi:hypothetical protein
LTTATDQVQVLLELAGITPTDEELAALVAQFPDVRVQIERMWAADLGESAPALVLLADGITGPGER